MIAEFCLIVLFGSILGSPLEITTETVSDEIYYSDDAESSTTERIDQGFTLVPVYEIKTASSPQTLKTCSPNCHLEIYDNPVFMVTKSDLASAEPEVVYLKDGLKSVDKTKLTDIDGQSVVVFPENSYPRIVKTDVLDSKTPSSNTPYVLFVNEDKLAEINREEMYEKVAEMRVSDEGFVTAITSINRPTRIVEEEATTDDEEGTNGKTREPTPKGEKPLPSDKHVAPETKIISKTTDKNTKVDSPGEPFRFSFYDFFKKYPPLFRQRNINTQLPTDTFNMETPKRPDVEMASKYWHLPMASPFNINPMRPWYEYIDTNPGQAFKYRDYQPDPLYNEPYVIGHDYSNFPSTRRVGLNSNDYFSTNYYPNRYDSSSDSKHDLGSFFSKHTWKPTLINKLSGWNFKPNTGILNCDMKSSTGGTILDVERLKNASSDIPFWHSVFLDSNYHNYYGVPDRYPEITYKPATAESASEHPVQVDPNKYPPVIIDSIKPEVVSLPDQKPKSVEFYEVSEPVYPFRNVYHFADPDELRKIIKFHKKHKQPEESHETQSSFSPPPLPNSLPSAFASLPRQRSFF